MAWDTMLVFLIGLKAEAPQFVEGVMRPHLVGSQVVLERKA
jgi:hypothetical protein